jgi:hypothetical protein
MLKKIVIALAAIVAICKLATSAKVNQNRTSRERKAKRLAEKLFFKLTRKGDRYSLCRTAGLSGPGGF